MNLIKVACLAKNDCWWLSLNSVRVLSVVLSGTKVLLNLKIIRSTTMIAMIKIKTIMIPAEKRLSWS